MSHIVGTLQVVSPAIKIGPDSGAAPTSANTWAFGFQHTPAPTGTKLLILHFAAASLSANNRLEVDLGYGGADSTDIFTAADGADFWTRPVNVAAFADGKVPIRYVTNGAANGSVTLDKYGRGERHSGDQDPAALSNCDPFLLDATYVEPSYDPFWFCSPPPNWENVLCLSSVADIRRTLAQSVGMIIHADKSEFLNPQIDVLSTCTVTLIGPDLVITAGHCMANPQEDAKSSSIIFDYAVNCDGTRPAGYAGRFFKVKKVVAQHYQPSTDRIDFCVLQLAEAPGLPAAQMRHDLPGTGEKVFGLHHPNGAVMKLSVPHPDFATVMGSDADDVKVPKNFHVSGGSSGSGLFDAAGRIVGVLADGNPCNAASSLLRYYPTASILQQIANPPVTPPISRDVMVVIDRSGSMSLAGSSGRPKLDEARDAASLFVQLVRTATGNRLGLVSFSTSPSTDLTLHDASSANKATLIGAAPFSGGEVGALVADGMTTIGGGLQTAAAQLPAAANPRSILLLTDGLQNTPPMIGDGAVQNAIDGIDINAIGYGTAANLDGALLTSLAQAHNGSYVRADSTLQLEKYFAQAFGNIFESGLLTDPEFDLAADQHTTPPLPFNVCGEETITVVVGWDNPDTTLFIEIKTPVGASILAGAAGTETSTGRSWTFLRVTLPHGGERDGAWQAIVFRPRGGGEFPPPAPATRYFVNVVANGGPRLKRVPDGRAYYTGDVINPLLFLTYGNGAGSPDNGAIRIVVTRPKVSAGNLLSQEKLKPPVTFGGDTIPARQATLQAIETATGQPSITYAQDTFDLLSGPANTNGAFEPGGLFGKPFTDLLTIEGNYTFHAIATYGEGCVSSRELQWSIHVDPSVDPTKTGISTTQSGTSPGGDAVGTVTLTPRDPYGNNVGPGRGDGLTVSGGPGTTVAGPVVDNGDGTYTVPVTWDPGSNGPIAVVGQPARPPIVIGPPTIPQPPAPPAKTCWWCWLWCLILLLLAILFFLLWLFN